MAKRGKYIAQQEDFQKYFNGQMTEQEQHDFEKYLLGNDFENEAFDGLSQLTPEGMNTDLKSLRSHVDSNLKRPNTFTFWKVAATLLLLGIFSFSTFYLWDWNRTTEIAQHKNVLTNEDTIEALSVPKQSMEEEQTIALNREDKKAPKTYEEIQLIEQNSSAISKEHIEVPDEVEIEELGLSLDLEDFGEPAIPQQLEAEESSDLIISKKENVARKAYEPSANKKVSSESIERSKDISNIASFSDQESIENPLVAPRPEDGEKQFDDYILKNLKYPESAVRDSVEGTVELQFTVGKDGEISNIKILKGIRHDIDEEAVRLIKESPAWIPARINDLAVAKQTIAKIRFQLKE